MSHLRGIPAVMLSLVLCSPPAFAAEPVGEATLIRTEVTGAGGPLVVKAPVHRDERIKTSISGLGQFIFRDGTKLAVGAGSSVVIDKYVYDDANSAKKLTIKAAKGTFRWISGNSSSSAYSIVTPAGTIGVRGTVFDFYVGPNGTTAMVLLSGAAQFCGAGGCKQLTRQCDCVIATRGGGVSDPRAVDARTLRALGNQRALPFLSGNQQLSGALGGIRTSCGLASLKLDRKDRAPQQPDPPPPATRTPPSPAPPPQEKPTKQQDKPTKQHEKPHHDRDKDHHWGRDRDGHHDRGDGDGPGWGNRSHWGPGDNRHSDHRDDNDRPGNRPGPDASGGGGRGDHHSGNDRLGRDGPGRDGPGRGGHRSGSDGAGNNGFGGNQHGSSSPGGSGTPGGSTSPGGSSSPGGDGPQSDGANGNNQQAGGGRQGDNGQRNDGYGRDRHGDQSNRARDRNRTGD